MRKLLLFISIVCVCFACGERPGVHPTYLRTEYKVNPYLDVAKPRLSWELESNTPGQLQTAYRVLVASSPQLLEQGQGDLWDSGKIESDATNQIEYEGAEIAAKTRVYWKVQSWDKDGQPGEWSDVAWWETGLLSDHDWAAEWIGYDLNEYGKGDVYHLPPAPYLRKTQELGERIESARLYVTALGVYEFFINGERVGNDYFAPGWTDYNQRVYYSVYDVTDKLLNGENAFAATLSYGWYSGYLGYALLVGTPQVRGFYGDVPLLRAQVEITYADGRREVVATDESWRASQGPLRETDLLQGETYDARLAQEGWNRPGFDDAAWDIAQVYTDQSGREIQIYPGDPVQVIQEFKPKSITPREDGKYIIDFGQNFAGVVRLQVKGNEGDSIVLRYGEMLHPDGALVTENLRMARATDTYVLRGDSEGEQWQPQFTFHGFQYVEIAGLREQPSEDVLVGLAMSSVTPEVGSFQTDNAMLNQLYSNIVWTQRSNYLDVPTDCPQRDERQGWTADAQIYIHSATFNTDIAAFHTKWVRDLNDSQWDNGAYPVYSPMPKRADGKAAIRASDTYSPGWSEAGVICVYELYRTYGDTRMVRESLPYMEKFMAFLRNKAGDDRIFKEDSFNEISPRGGFGDWLSVGKKTSPDLLATLYYAYCAQLMADMLEAVGDQGRAGYYVAEVESIMQAFLAHYSDEGGKFKTDAAVYGDGAGYVDGSLGFEGHTQTAYANAIYMQLLDAAHQGKAGQWLRDLVEANDGKLSTGFLGFRPLLPALSATGNSDLAYQLILSTEYPSLGFEVVNGATSIWERWDSYTQDRGFVHNASMNSFSHYAFGAVNEWMFGNMAGIRSDGIGYRKLVIKPEILEAGVNEVAGSYRSINGWIRSSWERTDGEVKQNVTIPVNTTARVYVPAQTAAAVTVNGTNLENSTYAYAEEDGHIVVNIGSGDYRFVSKTAN